MPMTMKRTLGLARFMARSLCDLERQIHIDVAPTELRRSSEQMLCWIEESLAQGMPMFIRLGERQGKFGVIVGMDHKRLNLIINGVSWKVRRNDQSLCLGLRSKGMCRVRVVRLEPIFALAKRITALGHFMTTHG